MLAVVALCLAISIAVGPAASRHGAAPVPSEPGVIVLPERPTLQAVVADLEGLGARDLVRLVEDGDRGRVLLEVWREKGRGWGQIGPGIEVVPEVAGAGGDVVFGGAPARLLVRDAGRAEHVTIVRQPHFRPPGTNPACCLQLHDVTVDRLGRVDLVPVGSDRQPADALLALDLDGDGVDELLASRSLPPLGRTAYPSEALVFRWQGTRFATPTVTELPIGSGDTPFILGETDGRPGEEAAIIATAARSALYRLSLDDGDGIVVENAQMAVRAAAAVATDAGPAIAVMGPVVGLRVVSWPAGEAPGQPVGTVGLARGRILGSVELDGAPVLLVEDGDDGTLRGFGLRDAAPVSGTPLALPAEASAMPAALRPYRGPLPGGDGSGRPALFADGWLLRSGVEPVETVTLGGAVPLGLAGSSGGWMGLLHAPAPGTALDPAGGRLAGTVPATATVSIAPVSLVMRPEPGGGVLDPDLRDAVRLDGEGLVGVAAQGFRVGVEAPPGARLHAGVGDGSAGLGVHRVPDDGRLEIRVPLPRVLLPYGGDRVMLGVVTPAGATYATSVDVVALTGPPPLTAAAHTPLGSSAVRIEGMTVPYATVSVDDRSTSVDGEGRFTANVELPPWPTPVHVSASDPLGNVARIEVTGVGIADYRALPWIPIAVALVVVAGLALFLRGPRPLPAARRLDDGVLLEELDPDERL